MEESQKVQILAAVKDHFSTATPSDALLVWEDCKGYAVDDVERAIVEHRKEKGSKAYRPDVRRIRALAAGYFRERQRDRWDSERTIDYLRRQPESAALIHGLPDEEAIEAHYTAAWGMVESSAEEGIGRNVARSYILLGARTSFVQIGLSEAEAERRARECVGLAPGEKIPRKPLFQTAEQPQTSWEARQQLAKMPEPERAA